MITGFEDITYELNDYEKNELLPILVQGFKNKIGKDKAVTSKTICRTLKAKGKKIDGPRLRKLVSYIRINRLVENLISTSKGYYIAETQHEVADYIQSLYEREMAIMAVRKSYAQK